MKISQLLKGAALIAALSICALGQNPVPAPFPASAAGGGGGGGVSAVATGCGTNGGTITTTGTIIAAETVNAQTGTTYTYLNGDCGKLVTHSNASAIAGTLPQANGSTFKSGWFMDVENTGAGLLTITPTTSTIDGAATLTLATNEGARIVSNGTNYFTQRGKLRTLVSADIPNNAANTTGQANTAVAAASNPTDCSTANTFANVIAASWALTCDYERLLSRAVTGTTDTILTGDNSKFITYSNASAIAGTLPQANGSTFADGFFFIAKNIGAGDVTITPTTSTISGAATIVISNGEFAIVRSDGTNYEAAGIRTVAGSNVTLTKARTGVTIAASGGGGTGCTPGGSAGIVQASDGGGACQPTAISDNGTTVASTEPVTAPSFATGTSPPTVTPGTGGADGYSEGTVPSVCAASAVDCLYADSTQHGFLANFNNGGYKPLVQGPTSQTSGRVASWNGTNGGLLADGGFLAADVVRAVAPGAGICHFAGSTQLCTSSAIVNADVTSIDAATKLTGITPSANGGTANGFTKFTGPTASEKTFTLPDANSTLTVTICAGTVALGTSAIASGAKDSTKTLPCTGAATTDIVRCSSNADISAVTGWVPSANGTLGILPPFATTNTINVIVENNTASSITPGAVTLNCGIWR